MAIPTRFYLANPYKDEVLAYDYDTHQYYMKLDASMNLTGIDLVEMWGGEDNAQFYLKLISDVVYNSILRYKDSKYSRKMLYYLSHSSLAREAITNLIKDTIHYNHKGGGFMMAYETGINLHEMKVMDVEPHKFLSSIGIEMLKRYGLAQRYFEYEFDLVESTTGSEW